MNTCARLLAIAWLLWGAGCATSRPPSGPAFSGDPLAEPGAFLGQYPERDHVLWQYRLAAAAMRSRQFDKAKDLLDSALSRIGVIIEADRSARKARSYFQEESRKTFFGEPYERSMAFFYRGILYWMDGQPDNARACFRNAQVQDSDTQDHQYAGDYALFDYLDGYISTRLSGSGQEALARAQAASRSGPLPPFDLQANVMVFAEMGQGPVKYAAGAHGEQLRFRPGSSPAAGIRIAAGSLSTQAGVFDDLSFQATTRGGRVMDHILANKAVFKNTTSALGDAALIGGTAVAVGGDHEEAALGLLAFGVLSKIVSGVTTPAADTRSWNNLPQYLSFAALRLPPGAHTLTIDFLDGAGSPMAGKTQTVKLNLPAGSRDAVVFVSDQPPNL
ncbi:MAG TPA: hypothetical protein P5555_00490 [Candidatus Paceibacterota bacterium]|nr:hypothetical protein [Verrucomicrobiota bacterium]HRZ43649.1 hypothetical protein [Candidatus Paceibacterota bacterium]HRZ91286.1 hypothetical protein [Candidatus Paceibacterota bacterium]